MRICFLMAAVQIQRNNTRAKRPILPITTDHISNYLPIRRPCRSAECAHFAVSDKFWVLSVRIHDPYFFRVLRSSDKCNLRAVGRNSREPTFSQPVPERVTILKGGAYSARCHPSLEPAST